MLGSKILGKKSKRQDFDLKSTEYVERRDNVDRVNADATIASLKELAIAIIKVDWYKIKANMAIIMSIIILTTAICYIGNAVQQYYAKLLTDKALNSVSHAAKYQTPAINNHIEIVKGELSSYLSKAGKSMGDLSKSNCEIPKYERVLIPLKHVCDAGKDFMLRIEASKNSSQEILSTAVNNVTFEEFVNQRPYKVTTEYLNNIDSYMQELAPKTSKMFIMYSDDDFITPSKRNNGIYSLREMQMLYISKAPSEKGIDISNFYNKEQIQFWVNASNSIVGEVIFSVIFSLAFISYFTKRKIRKAAKAKKISLTKEIETVTKQINEAEEILTAVKVNLVSKKQAFVKRFKHETEHKLLDNKLRAENSYNTIDESNGNMINDNNTRIIGIDTIINKAIVDDIENRYNIEALDFVNLSNEVADLQQKLNNIHKNHRTSAERTKLNNQLNALKSKFNNRYDGGVKSDLEELVNRYNVLIECKEEKRILQGQNSDLIQERLNAHTNKDSTDNEFNKFLQEKSTAEDEINADTVLIETQEHKIKALKNTLRVKIRALNTLKSVNA